MGFAWLVRLSCPHQEQQKTHFFLDEHIGLIDNRPPDVKSYVCVGMVLSVRFSNGSARTFSFLFSFSQQSLCVFAISFSAVGAIILPENVTLSQQSCINCPSFDRRFLSICQTCQPCTHQSNNYFSLNNQQQSNQVDLSRLPTRKTLSFCAAVIFSFFYLCF